jgi:acetylornithine deacetylase
VNDRVAAVNACISDDEILEIEKDLVRIPSYTTEESELANFIADLLDREKVEVGLQPVSFDGIRLAPTHRSHNVIGRLHGTGEGPTILFNGHMDHGPIGGRQLDDLSKWQRNPFDPVVEGGHLYGKGCQDEKGGICAMLSTIIAMRRAGIRPKGSLIVAPVCGHKTLSRGTHRLLEWGIRADMAVNTENSGNAIVPLHVGVYLARITVRGAHPHPAIRDRHHLSGKPTPFQRIQQLIEALGPEARPYPENSWLRFQRHDILKDFPWHHIEQIDSRGYSSRILHVWWRTPPGVTADSLERDLQDLLGKVSQEDPGFQARAELEAYGPALETPSDHPLVSTLAKWQGEYSGRAPNVGPEGRYGGYGDAAVLAAAGIPSVAYGPGGGLTDLEHTFAAMEGKVAPDERIPVVDLITAARTCIAASTELIA